MFLVPGTEYAYFDKMGLNDAAAFLRITAEMISSVSCPQSKKRRNLYKS